MGSVLIVGAGIAGDTAALLLERAGWRVLVVEQAPELRSGGQTVDLRGGSASVLERLGLLEQCRDARVPQSGMAWPDARGRWLARMPVEAFDGQGFVSTDELLRTDLAQLIHSAGGDGITHWFGESITALVPQPGGIRASFRHHPDAVFDLVIGADGTHSIVRSTVFGPEEEFRKPLGLAHAWFTLREDVETPKLDGWFLLHNTTGSRTVEARPGHPGEQEAAFTFPAKDLPDRRDRNAQFALLETLYSDVGWRADELLAAARTAPDFAMDTFDQIHLERWHDGRVVLLGDSAWCASPLSGLGTALALSGAEKLANSLTSKGLDVSSDSDVASALASYEVQMRPLVASAQKLIPGRVKMYAPRTTVGIRAVMVLTTVVQLRPIAWLLTKLLGGSASAHRKEDDPS